MNSGPNPVQSPRDKVPQYAALILAAGNSSRMVALKPLLPIGAVTVVEAAIKSFRAAGITEITVVVGNRADEIRPFVERAGGRCTVNPHFAEGMFSLILAGIASLPVYATACFILPVDMPLVRSHTICRIARVYARRKLGILYPVFAGRHGHAPLVSRAILDEALAQGRSGNLRTLLRSHAAQAGEVSVHDEGILLDMDTPQDYERMAVLACERDVPSNAECEDILAARKVDDRVLRHSRLVAAIADALCAGLSGREVALRATLVHAGAILHDLVRKRARHANKGAKIVEALGFPVVAAIVRAHMDLSFQGAIDEAAIVYLADKLVLGDRVVSIDLRFADAINRYGDEPTALRGALRRRATACAIAREVEKRLARGLLEFLADALQ